VSDLLSLLYRHRLSPSNGSQRHTFILSGRQLSHNFSCLQFLATDPYSIGYCTLVQTEDCLSPNSACNHSAVKVKVTIRPTVSRPVSLGVKIRLLILSDSCGFVDVGRPICRGNGSVIYTCQNQCTCHLYLQFYISAFYTIICQESGSL
jgi:hypothetical protein